MKPIAKTEEMRLEAHIKHAKQWLAEGHDYPPMVDASRLLIAAHERGGLTPARAREINDESRGRPFPEFLLDDCSACGKYVPITVTVGQESDYESHTAYLCPACLREAVALLPVPE